MATSGPNFWRPMVAVKTAKGSPKKTRKALQARLDQVAAHDDSEDAATPPADEDVSAISSTSTAYTSSIDYSSMSYLTPTPTSITEESSSSATPTPSTTSTQSSTETSPTTSESY